MEDLQHRIEAHEKGEFSLEATNDHEGSPQNHERELTSAEVNHGNKETVEAHREKARNLALSQEDARPAAETELPKNTHPLIASLQLKTAAWSRQMTRTRKRLRAPDRVFSKVIHSPVIDKPSEFIGKTIARPQGMLWGSIVAFFGTSALLWATNYYGYEFNYLLVVLLFLGGSLFGTAIEALNYAFRKDR